MAVSAITLDILHIYRSVGTSLRHAFFQGLLHHHHHRLRHRGTSTPRPAFSKAILVMLMFIGACAGSTGGGKVARLVILTKSALCDMKRMLHLPMR